MADAATKRLPTFAEVEHLGTACERPEGPYTVLDGYDVRCSRCVLALAALVHHDPEGLIEDQLEDETITTAEAYRRYGRAGEYETGTE